ncbi:hypothetical protein PENANT_c007G04773 [Penicillium antarcticum]|uniref:Uncharacterized protein n=1 Tax=Penicillium antarcticum TaxID=416450 RepID=A0A1V6QBL5_9EURO|nr:hypothetical protein PENANT_c007G04773 [Penicillium antarcticum]
MPKQIDPYIILIPVLQDDELGEYIELSFLVYVGTSSQCERALDRSGLWKSFHGRRRVFDQLGISRCTADWESNPELLANSEVLSEKWYFTNRGSRVRLRFTNIPKLQSGYTRFFEDLGLWRYSRILHDCRTQAAYEDIQDYTGSRQNPEEFIRKPTEGRDAFPCDDTALDYMQESMRHLLGTGRALSGLEEEPMIAERLLPALNAALNDKISLIPTRLVFGMEMLLSTYKAYMWPSGHMINCRILSLKFAHAVIQSVKECMPLLQRFFLCHDLEHCTCLQKEYLSKYQNKVQAYVEERRFDLYYQAPWTAGGHMVEILHWSIYEGINLCCENNYVNAVLQLHNTLRNVNPQMKRVRWLDQMCDVFTNALFMGTLPKRTFSFAFRRSAGAQLVKSSRMFYQPTKQFVVRLYLGNQVNDPTPSQIKEALHQINSTIWTVTMEKVKEAMSAKFQGDAPIAKIDFFAVFRACIKILEDLCTHLGHNTRGDARLGFELVDSLLKQLTEYERDAKIAHKLPPILLLKKAVLPLNPLMRRSL